MKALYCLFIFLILADFSSCQINDYAPGYDFSLFRNTPVYELANAVENQDTIEIQKLVKNNFLNVDYREPKFGNTLLLLAIVNNKNLSASKLLNLGSNPNLRTFNGKSPFLAACFGAREIKEPRKILQMLINHGADVNSVQVDTTFDQFGKRQDFQASALMLACSYGNLESVKVLVENGASLTSYGNNEDAILSNALTSRNLDIVKYLMINKHAPIPDYCVLREPGTREEKKLTMTDLLNEVDYTENKEKQKLKLEIIDYLRNKGKR
jgi:ankyrin repeat protein